MSTEISIKQLPQITEINNDDLLLVQTPNATNTLLFSNFIIGLDNTTFSSTITQNSTDIQTLSTTIDGLSSDIDSLSGIFRSDIDTLSTNLDTLSGVFYDNTPTTITDTFSGIPITINGTTFNIIVSATA
tara:strand:- start:5739 stop:6128 length:390 start_codon:yes stop_codon:yes gene_type:complete